MTTIIMNMNMLEYKLRDCSFMCRLSTFVILPKPDHIDPLIFLDDARETFKILIRVMREEHIMIKVNVTFVVEFLKYSSNNDEIIEKIFFNTRNRVIDQAV